MPELAPDDPHRASAGARWHPSVRQKDYVYRGLGYDIYEDTRDYDAELDYRRRERQHQADVAAMWRALEDVWDMLEANGWRI